MHVRVKPGYTGPLFLGAVVADGVDAYDLAVDRHIVGWAGDAVLCAEGVLARTAQCGSQRLLRYATAHARRAGRRVAARDRVSSDVVVSQ
jgi:hypothetical protein